METNLPFRLDRTVDIQASPAIVFRFFTDSERWAKWWGAGSTIDARPGGRIYLWHPNGIESEGEVVELTPPDRIVFTYGFTSGQPIPPGASRVTVHLAAVAAGTRLTLVHELADAATRDAHVQGWRFQLSLFANAVADEVFAGANAQADAWFDVRAIADDAARAAAFAAICAPGVTFRDRYSALAGIDELSAHAGAAQRFMPGIRLRRAGNVRQCQGTALSEWTAHSADGVERIRGTNVVLYGPDGRFAAVTAIGS
ncbi:MAG: SRPBCC domain-containing protein [Acidobacteria bacterium]|nr:SRPBCC domain-containing protein [Acidobacteriota bacterium]